MHSVWWVMPKYFAPWSSFSAVFYWQYLACIVSLEVQNMAESISTTIKTSQRKPKFDTILSRGHFDLQPVSCSLIQPGSYCPWPKFQSPHLLGPYVWWANKIKGGWPLIQIKLKTVCLKLIWDYGPSAFNLISPDLVPDGEMSLLL